MSKETTGQVFGLMDNLLEKIRAEKRAAQKRATDGSEPTTHPVMNAPDGTQPAREGSRSAENESDVESDYGVLGNTGQEDANSATSEKPTDSIGTQSQSSDEVKGNVAKPKPVKDGPAENGRGDASPGHPSNETFSGEEAKYASAITAGNKLLSLLATAMGKSAQEDDEEDDENEGEGESENAQKKENESMPSEKSDADDKEKAAALKKKAKNTKITKSAEELKKAAAHKYREEAEAGYMAAGLLAEQLGFGKQAADEQTAVNMRLEGIIKTAQDDADLFADYLQGLETGQNRVALEGRAAMKKMAQPGLEGMDLGAAPAIPAGEGVPAAALMGAGGDEGGGEEDAAAVELLAQALAEAGIGPEELAAIAEGGAGGAGGGEEPAEPGEEHGGEGQGSVAEEAAAEGEPIEEEKAEKEANLKLKAQRKLMALLSR